MIPLQLITSLLWISLGWLGCTSKTVTDWKCFAIQNFTGTVEEQGIVAKWNVRSTPKCGSQTRILFVSQTQFSEKLDVQQWCSDTECSYTIPRSIFTQNCVSYTIQLGSKGNTFPIIFPERANPVLEKVNFDRDSITIDSSNFNGQCLSEMSAVWFKLSTGSYSKAQNVSKKDFQPRLGLYHLQYPKEDNSRTELIDIQSSPTDETTVEIELTIEYLSKYNGTVRTFTKHINPEIRIANITSGPNSFSITIDERDVPVYGYRLIINEKIHCDIHKLRMNATPYQLQIPNMCDKSNIRLCPFTVYNVVLSSHYTEFFSRFNREYHFNVSTSGFQTSGDFKGWETPIQNLSVLYSNSSDIQLRWKMSSCERERSPKMYLLSVDGRERFVKQIGTCFESCFGNDTCLHLMHCPELNFIPAACTTYTVTLGSTNDGQNVFFNQSVHLTTNPDDFSATFQSLNISKVIDYSIEFQVAHPICTLPIDKVYIDIYNGTHRHFHFVVPAAYLNESLLHRIEIDKDLKWNGKDLAKTSLSLPVCQENSLAVGIQYNKYKKIFWKNSTFTIPSVNLNVTSKLTSSDLHLSWITSDLDCNISIEIRIMKDGLAIYNERAGNSPLIIPNISKSFEIEVRALNSRGTVLDEVIIKHIEVDDELDEGHSYMYYAFLLLLPIAAFIIYSFRILIGRKKQNAANEVIALRTTAPDILEVRHSKNKNDSPDCLPLVPDVNEEHAKLEYEKVQNISRKITEKQTYGANPGLKWKNRYPNIIPYDFNRVALSILPENEYSDYINASFVQGFHKDKEFIACQGPLPKTVNDFWRMIWEQEIHIIVMLTPLTENGKKRCEQYWPDEETATMFDDIIVNHLSKQIFENYIIQSLKVSMSGIERYVTHFQFINWPDFGCPKDPETLILFVETVRKEVVNQQIASPILVHCSAGVGRTGTFIAMDWLMHQINEGIEINISDTVLLLRRCRVRMVQTEAQFVFLHHCVNHYKITRMLKNNNETNIYVNVT